MINVKAKEMYISKIVNMIMCTHQETTIDCDLTICTECGLTFDDEVVYDREVYNTVLRKPTKTKGKRTRKMDTKPKPKPKEPEIKPKEPEIKPKSVKDLVTIAKGRGIKNSTTMSKKKLCEILGLEIVKPDKLAFKNRETGEERRFQSIYRASKEMGVNPGLIHHHIDTSGMITVDGVIHDVWDMNQYEVTRQPQHTQ